MLREGTRDNFPAIARQHITFTLPRIFLQPHTLLNIRLLIWNLVRRLRSKLHKPIAQLVPEKAHARVSLVRRGPLYGRQTSRRFNSHAQLKISRRRVRRSCKLSQALEFQEQTREFPVSVRDARGWRVAVKSGRETVRKNEASAGRVSQSKRPRFAPRVFPSAEAAGITAAPRGVISLFRDFEKISGGNSRGRERCNQTEFGRVFLAMHG